MDEQPINLQTIADWLVSVNDDVVPDEYFEVEWSEASDQECMHLIRLILLRGSCAEFCLGAASEAWLADRALHQPDVQQGALTL